MLSNIVQLANVKEQQQQQQKSARRSYLGGRTWNRNKPRGTGINTVNSRVGTYKVEDLKVVGKVKDHTKIMENSKNIDIYIKIKLTVEITKSTMIRLNLKLVNWQITLIGEETLEHLNIS